MEDIKKDENIEKIEKVDEPIIGKVEEKPLTFTQIELDNLINKRLERASKKAEIEKEEAKRLAKMSEAERQQAEFENEKASFAEERKQYQKEKLELQVVKELGTKGLPTEFSKYLIGEDAEICMSNIKEFDTKWQQAIAKAVNEKLKGKTPNVGGGNLAIVNPWNTSTRNLTEQGRIYKENPALAEQLMASSK